MQKCKPPKTPLFTTETAFYPFAAKSATDAIRLAPRPYVSRASARSSRRRVAAAAAPVVTVYILTTLPAESRAAPWLYAPMTFGGIDRADLDFRSAHRHYVSAGCCCCCCCCYCRPTRWERSLERFRRNGRCGVLTPKVIFICNIF